MSLCQDWVALVKAASAAARNRGNSKPRTSANSNKNRDEGRGERSEDEDAEDDFDDDEQEEESNSDKPGTSTLPRLRLTALEPLWCRMPFPVASTRTRPFLTVFSMSLVCLYSSCVSLLCVNTSYLFSFVH